MAAALARKVTHNWYPLCVGDACWGDARGGGEEWVEGWRKGRSVQRWGRESRLVDELTEITKSNGGGVGDGLTFLNPKGTAIQKGN